MLSNTNLYEEIEIAEKVMKDSKDMVELTKALIKIGTLQLKLLHNLRVNSVRAMKHAGMTFEKRSTDE